MKPKYNFFKNTKYAIEGLLCMIKCEKSFRIELILGSFFIIFSLFLPLSLSLHLLLIAVIFLIFIAECVNSAIENCVDMITLEFNEYAKKAKDIGSAAVFCSIFLAVIVWFCTIFSLF